MFVFMPCSHRDWVNNWAKASYRGRDFSVLYRFTTVYLLRQGRRQTVVRQASKVSRPGGTGS